MAKLYDNSKVYKNLMINGNFDIWQRGTSLTTAPDQTILADRWKYQKSGTHQVTYSQDASIIPNNRSSYSLSLQTTTANASPTSTDYSMLFYRMEGFDWAQVAGREFTLGFWVYDTKVGLHNFWISNVAGDKGCCATYTVNSTNTWEWKTIQFPAAPLTGTWNYTNGQGAQMAFTLLAGTTYQVGTPGVWQNTQPFGVAGMVNSVDSTSNVFKIAQVMFVVGSVQLDSTDFVRNAPSIADELYLCQRYYEKSYPQSVYASTSTFAGGQIVSIYGTVIPSGAQYATTVFRAVKRTTPTVTMYSTTGVANKLTDIGSPTAQAVNSALPQFNGDSSVAASNGSAGTIPASTSAYQYHWVADAEL